MTRTRETSPFNGWRIAGWGALLALLLLPAVAMQFTDEVLWTAGDFVFAVLLLGALGTGVELAVRFGRSGSHRVGLVASAFAAFLTLWVNAAVGIIGEGSINIAFTVLVAVAVLAAVVTRLRARAMAYIAGAVVAGVIATGLAAEFTFQPDWGPVLFFALAWLVPTLLFRNAASG